MLEEFRNILAQYPAFKGLAPRTVSAMTCQAIHISQRLQKKLKNDHDHEKLHTSASTNMLPRQAKQIEAASRSTAVELHFPGAGKCINNWKEGRPMILPTFVGCKHSLGNRTLIS